MEINPGQDTHCFRFLLGASFQYTLRLPVQNHPSTNPFINIVYAQQNCLEKVFRIEGQFITANYTNSPDIFRIKIHYLDSQRNTQTTEVISPKSVNFEIRITPENQGTLTESKSKSKVSNKILIFPESD